MLNIHIYYTSDCYKVMIKGKQIYTEVFLPPGVAYTQCESLSEGDIDTKASQSLS